MRIYINPGHGGTDSGAVGIGGRKEKNDALRYAKAVAEKLKNRGNVIKLERDSDYYIPVKEIAKKANEWDADLFISFHRNYGGGHGSECLVVSSASQTSRNLAKYISDELARIGFRNRGVKVQDRNTYVLSHTRMPATTIECGFVDSNEDNILFDTKFDEIVDGIVNAISKIAGTSPVAPEPIPDIPQLNRLLKRLSPMMRGGDVKMAQQRLVRHHALSESQVDGIFGDRTKNAVIAFQRARKNEGRDIGSVDGIIGQKTWSILWE